MAKHYSESEMGKVLGMKHAGKTYREISEKLKIPISSISHIITKDKIYGSTKHRCGNGRPKKLNMPLTKFLLKEIDINKKISCRQLAKKVEEELGDEISHSSVRNYLNENNLYSYPPRNKPLLKPRHIKARFEASERWIKLPEEKVKTMIFSDESKFNLQNSDGVARIWRHPKTGLDMENINGTLKFSGGSVMVWGCFSYYGVGELTFIDVKMDAPYYCNMLSSSLFNSVRKMGLSEYIFVQDNDPKHTSKLAKSFFVDNNITVEPWPAQSPDCNPLENIWGYIKHKIGDKIFTSKQELKDEIRRQWENIPVELCQKLALSFKKRAIMVYRAKGGHIDY